MNTLMVAYGVLLTMRREASGSPPVICIDDAHVLMGWEVTGTCRVTSKRCCISLSR